MSPLMLGRRVIRGRVDAPPSKSYAQRCILAAMMGQGTSRLQNVGCDDDTLAMSGVCGSFGARIYTAGGHQGTLGYQGGNFRDHGPDQWTGIHTGKICPATPAHDSLTTEAGMPETDTPQDTCTARRNYCRSNPSVVSGTAQKKSGICHPPGGNLWITGNPFFYKERCTDRIFCGESGLAARLILPAAALFPHPITLTGRGSLTGRPFAPLVSALEQLGALVAGDTLPLEICGPIHGGEVTIDGSLSSQFISGLLMALPLLQEDSTIFVHRCVSRGYIDVTLDVMEAFGVIVCTEDPGMYRIPGRQTYTPCNITIEGDWSGSAAILTAGAIAGEVTVTGLNPLSAQPDRAVLNLLADSGADVRVNDTSVSVRRGELHGFVFDASECPDLVPVAAALAANCIGSSTIIFPDRLRCKESNRPEVICTQFQRLGITAECEGEHLNIEGGAIRGGETSASGDHRIAMALALCSLRSEGPVVLEQWESVGKSYPSFWHDLDKLTFRGCLN